MSGRSVNPNEARPRRRPLERLAAAISGRARLGAAVGLTVLVVGAPAAFAALRTITRSDAAAVASAIAIHHGDLPTLKQQGNPTTSADNTSSAQLTACAGGVPESKSFANTPSPAFVTTNDSLTISSDAEILPSAALVDEDFAAFERPLALTCLHTLLTKELRGEFPKGDKVATSVERFPSVIPSVGKSFGLRFAIVVALKEGKKTVSVAVYDDVVGFAYGQAEVTLNVQTTLTPPSKSLESRLAALLVARAKTAIG